MDQSKPLAAVEAGRVRRRAAGALFVATVFWGMGFTWAKSAGEAVNAASGRPPGAGFGPVWLLGVRFSLGAAVWLALFPAARRGWGARPGRSVLLGLVLAAGLVCQHLGLDQTSEAVSAFLTNLTVIFVPLLVALVGRRWPARRLAGPVGMASVGIYLMTGASPRGFGGGEWLGLACGVLFSVYMVLLDGGGPGEEPFRSTAIQFVVVGVVCLLASAALAGGHLPVGVILSDRRVCVETLLLTLLPTVGSYGLMMRFQPRIDPTRAALIYLSEPVVAAAWAWGAAGRTLGPLAVAGAVLIVLANALAAREGHG